VSVYENFEQEPFAPLSEHMEKVQECVSLVKPMFEALGRQDYDQLQVLSKQIFKVEHQADQVKKEIRERMPKSFYLPIFRGDLLAYLKLQDDIADSCEDLAVILTLKKLSMPEVIAGDVNGLVDECLKTCELIFACSEHLKGLAENDFSKEGGRIAKILDLVDQAEQAEWETDKAEYHLAQKLFTLEDEMKATDIFLWSNMLQQLGRLANHADKTAERLRRMLVK